jgi:DNA invertase Pin-like site-specific DNA recombinase
MKPVAGSYLRTSSAANVGGDSDVRQREAIASYAKRTGMVVGAEFYDAAVSGADPIDQREGFTALLAWCAETGTKVVLVENASRFARDLAVQLAGHALLRQRGIELVPVDAPTYFTDPTPTAEMVRQILGAVSQFEKASLVAKLRGARDRQSAVEGKRIEGRKGYSETAPEMVREAKRLARKNPKTGAVRSLLDISAELAALGYKTAKGNPFSASQVARLIGR